MGLSDGQAQDVGFLVREHLLLAETATRRDLNDPKTTEKSDLKTMLLKVKVESVKATDYSCREQ